jgi:hypothetical protein
VQKPDSQSPLPVPDGMPGGFLSVSADGGKQGTGIVWACTPYDANANWDTVPGVMRAYDASNLAREIWNSKMNAARDDIGMFAKFCAPTIANGKVYASTFSNQLQVYGLLDGTLPTIDKLSASRGHLVVHYTKPVESLSASRPTNYVLDKGIRVLRASLDGSDKQTVYLATTPLHKGVLYTLTAQGVRDRTNLNAALPAATHAWVRMKETHPTEAPPPQFWGARLGAVGCAACCALFSFKDRGKKARKEAPPPQFWGARLGASGALLTAPFSPVTTRGKKSREEAPPPQFWGARFGAWGAVLAAPFSPVTTRGKKSREEAPPPQFWGARFGAVWCAACCALFSCNNKGKEFGEEAPRPNSGEPD